MYEDKEYLNTKKTISMEEISYLEDGEKEKKIKRVMDKWIEEQSLELEHQNQLNEKLINELKNQAEQYSIKEDSELYRTLLIDVKEMLALKLTVLSLMEGISDESFEPIPLK